MKRTPTPAMDITLTKDFLASRSKQRVARLLGVPTFPRPTVATLDENGFLRWKWYRHFESHGQMLEEVGARHRPPALRTPPPDLCFRFAKLASGDNEQIRVFAEKWGPLGTEDRAEERVDDWRRYAALADALLRFTAVQVSGGRGSDTDWSTICKSTAAKNLDRSHLTAAEQSAVTALAVNTWFALARGHRIVDLVKARLQIRSGASNLLGVLITQIAHVMARSDESAVCANCNKAFPPKQPRSRGSRRYCPKCRKDKVPQRDASRDWRRRRRTGSKAT